MEDLQIDIRENRAADSIVSEIERRIADGSLRDQEPLPSERALMEEFGASRTVVREAITALSNRGLVICKPRFRPVVRKLGFETLMSSTDSIVRHLLGDTNGVRNLYDVRVFIERGLVRDAATKANKSDIQALKSALQANEDAMGDSNGFYATDVAFHGVLYAIPGNPVFPAIHEGLVSWLAPHWARMLRSPERNRRNYLAHKAIYDSILERDPDAAEEALLAHLKAAWEFVSVTFDFDDQEAPDG
ncbi:MAG: FCD domain-containing protein [Planctomycetota bacterium]